MRAQWKIYIFQTTLWCQGSSMEDIYLPNHSLVSGNLDGRYISSKPLSGVREARWKIYIFQTTLWRQGSSMEDIYLPNHSLASGKLDGRYISSKSLSGVREARWKISIFQNIELALHFREIELKFEAC